MMVAKDLASQLNMSMLYAQKYRKKSDSNPELKDSVLVMIHSQTDHIVRVTFNKYNDMIR